MFSLTFYNACLDRVLGIRDMDSPGSSCLCTLDVATTSWLSSTPPTPTAQSTSSHSLPSSQPASPQCSTQKLSWYLCSASVFPLEYDLQLDVGIYRHTANPNKDQGTRRQSPQLCLNHPSKDPGLWTLQMPINLHQRGQGLWTTTLLRLGIMDMPNKQL